MLFIWQESVIFNTISFRETEKYTTWLCISYRWRPVCSQGKTVFAVSFDVFSLQHFCTSFNVVFVDTKATALLKVNFIIFLIKQVKVILVYNSEYFMHLLFLCKSSI
jgi:hypothetical protein